MLNSKCTKKKPIAILAIAAALSVVSCVGDGILRARGVVLTPEGQPVADAVVRLNNAARGDQVVTDQKGCFAISRPAAPGLYRFKLIIGAENYTEARRKLRSLKDNILVVELYPVDRAGKSSITSVKDNEPDFLKICGE